MSGASSQEKTAPEAIRADFADPLSGARGLARSLDLAAESAERILALLGRVDHVTLLPNRAQFIDDVDRLTAESAAPEGSIVILVTLAEARHFNEILRAVGHAYSEDFVRAGASRLRSALAAGTDIYHVSVLSFVFVIDDAGGEEAERLAATLARAFDEPLSVEGIPIDTRVGVGLVRLKQGREGAAEVLRESLAAAQDSRATAGGWSWYNRRTDQDHVRGFRMLSDLKAAISCGDGLFLNYQPRIDMRSRRLAGVEALVRWHHPAFGLVPPSEFVPLAETSALIRPLTRWVLHEALRTTAEWARSGILTRVSINVSPKNIAEPDFLDFITSAAREAEVEPERIELEFTEGTLASGRRTAAQMEALRAAGIALAIDDFGSGYSNMSYLASLPANVLKIDQSFIRPLDRQPRNAMLIRSIIALGHDLGYRIVGEGIETEASFDKLADWGCDEGQGYLMSRPLGDRDFRAWYHSSQH